MAAFPHRTTLRGAAIAAVALGLAAAAAGGAIVGFGLYDVASTDQHFQPTHSLLEYTMRASVRRQAAGIRPPALDHVRAQRGATVYAAHCTACHGGPGVAPQPFALGMQPVPGALIDAARNWQSAELYWITRHGIKMSGMPAWQYRLDESALWDVVAFLQRLPLMSPADYEEALAGADAARRAASDAVNMPAPTADASLPDAHRGKLALTQYGCHACHLIPGITGSRVHIGPPLAGLASRTLIAGKLRNTPDNLARWIRTPQLFDPRTAMPAMGVTERDARDMAAYLGRLD
ncbi:c-type cytochrome [Duganella sp. FT92W]|uniref:C-type cytochrome n=1 Tax=Pseudoduganella rivuli TaxID=2666085 RepID=A0A7X2LV22_9BURK|nr:c-type cytochrome [Pseudoduganella rivuli]MRV73622.1 c-type cytochrome [Pseudoduganella rivuli]